MTGVQTCALRICLDHHLHPSHLWRHEVPRSVNYGGIGPNRELIQCPSGGQALRLGHTEQIAFVVGTRTAAPQVVVVRAPSSTSSSATLQVATRTAQGWVCGTARPARVGRNGVRPLLERRSGDGTTPAGVFPLGRMTAWDGQRFSFFGNAADPGVVAGPYRTVRTGDCFGATPNDPDYGHLVERPAAECPGPDDEYLPRFIGVYAHAALIGEIGRAHV